MHRSWIFDVVLGCGGSKQAQPTVVNTTPADPQSCARVADHVIDLMSADAKDAPPQSIKETHDMVLQHCDADKWSAELRRCVAGLSSREEGRRCEELMTDAQKNALGVVKEKAPPTMEPAGSTRSSAPKKGGDPCEGGE